MSMAIATTAASVFGHSVFSHSVRKDANRTFYISPGGAATNAAASAPTKKYRRTW
jgi:hypothetical protein